jgi:hypothetical protein
MFYSANNEGDKHFTIDTKDLREIKRELTHTGARREISVPYWTQPSEGLLSRANNMGLKFEENKDRLGRYVVVRVN